MREPLGCEPLAKGLFDLTREDLKPVIDVDPISTKKARALPGYLVCAVCGSYLQSELDVLRESPRGCFGSLADWTLPKPRSVLVTKL